MKRLALFVLVACSSKTSEPPPPPTQVAPAPVRQPKNAADSQLAQRPCDGASTDFVGSWVGARPFDSSNPFLHRGPTNVVITKTDTGLHYKEGVGAAAIEVDLAIDPSAPNVARGAKHATETKRALGLDNPKAPLQELTISLARELAICLDAAGGLHVGRVLGASGEGIQTIDEADVAVLEREPPPPPAPPVPAGFTVLAEGQEPTALSVGATDLAWSNSNGDVPVTHSIRAVAKAGGTVRELASQLSNVRSLQIVGDHVYFAEQGSFRIGRVPLAGGDVETVVADTGAIDLAITKDMIVWSDLKDQVNVRALAGGPIRRLVAPVEDVTIRAVATDGSTVFVATSPIDYKQRGKVMRVWPSMATIATDTVCGALFVARGEPWWSSCEGDIRRSGKPVVEDLPDVAGIAVTKRSIFYVLGAGRGEVHVAPAGGGRAKPLVTGLVYPLHVIADGDVAYVDDQGRLGAHQGRIGRVTIQ